MEIVNERCAGLDVHKKSVSVCVWKKGDKGKVTKEIRTFGTMTADILVLYDWLLAHGVTHVAMESTGVYWKPVHNLLESGFTVLLVNPGHIKAVPGRKTDVKDSEWIADLLAHGLLRGGFIPPPPIRELRDLTRYRKSLTEERIREVNRLHKLLESANIKLTSVASKIMGVSAQLMLQGLMEGTTDPEVLANLARGVLRKKLPDLRKALEGRFTPHHRFMLETILGHIDFLDEWIEKVSAEVEERIRPFARQVELLDTIPGVDRRIAEVIIAEIGVDMGCFPTDRHITSWAGVCPGNNESAGKHRTGKVRKGDRWLRKALCEGVKSNTRSQNYLSAQYRRLSRRRGKKKAMIAVADSMLVISYHILKNNVPYHDLGADYFEKLNAAYVQRHYVKKLENLGFRVVLEPLDQAA